MPNDVKFIRGNIFKSSAQTLVNTVNCVGVMGAGIALEFRYRFPDMYEKYVRYCRSNLIEIGKLWIYEVPGSDQKILNFPTKKDWKHPSKYEYLEKGLSRFLETYKEKGIKSIAFPLLGAQNGGLDPEKVKHLMLTLLLKCDIPVEIYEYLPSAADDLLPVVREEFTYTSTKQLEKKLGLNTTKIQRIKQIVDQHEIYSLTQLVKHKGIGEETAKKIYSFAMSHKSNRIHIPLNIFHQVVEGSNLTTVQKTTGDALAEKSNTTVSPQSKKSKKRQSNTKVTRKLNAKLTLEQKMLYTGLPETTISKIEAADKNVTVYDILTYCKGLNINFRTFIIRQYSNSSDDTSSKKDH